MPNLTQRSFSAKRSEVTSKLLIYIYIIHIHTYVHHIYISYIIYIYIYTISIQCFYINCYTFVVLCAHQMTNKSPASLPFCQSSSQPDMNCHLKQPSYPPSQDQNLGPPVLYLCLRFKVWNLAIS